jgi:hypothetical protein
MNPSPRALFHALRARVARLSAAIVAVAAGASLFGCGGSSGGPPPAPDCTGDAIVGFVYPALHPGESPPPVYDGFIGTDAQVGAPLTTGRPVLRAQTQQLDPAPAGCLDSAHYAIAGTLPPGMSFDAATGVVSGTPSATGLYDFTVTLTVPWWDSPTRTRIEFRVNDSALFAYSGWDAATGGTFSSVDISFLGRLGDALFGLTATEGPVITTARSTDGGATWVPDAAAAAPPLRGDPGVGQDGGAHVWLAGGYLSSDTSSSSAPGYLDDVWVYDGSAWTQQAAHAAFGPRSRALVFASGTDLFLVGGGNNVTGSSDDVWRSADAGRTWTMTAAHLLPAPPGPSGPYLQCAADLGGTAVVIAWNPAATATQWYGQTQAWSSGDRGVTWVRHVVPDTSPLLSTEGVGTAQCVVDGGRLFVLGSTPGRVLSTADLDHWDFQPGGDGQDFFHEIEGAAALGGHLYVAHFGAEPGGGPRPPRGPVI